MTRRALQSAESLVSCIIHVSGFTVVYNPDVKGSNPAVDRVFHVFLHTRQHVFIFQQHNLGFFQNFMIIGMRAFFLKTYPFSDITEAKCFFLNYYEDLTKMF